MLKIHLSLHLKISNFQELNFCFTISNGKSLTAENDNNFKVFLFETLRCFF